MVDSLAAMVIGVGTSKIAYAFGDTPENPAESTCSTRANWRNARAGRPARVCRRRGYSRARRAGGVMACERAQRGHPRPHQPVTPTATCRGVAAHPPPPPRAATPPPPHSRTVARVGRPFPTPVRPRTCAWAATAAAAAEAAVVVFTTARCGGVARGRGGGALERRVPRTPRGGAAAVSPPRGGGEGGLCRGLRDSHRRQRASREPHW